MPGKNVSRRVLYISCCVLALLGQGVGQSGNVKADCPKGPDAQGTVTIDGKAPPPGLDVAIAPVQGEERHTKTIDSKGTFVVKSLKEGDYNLSLGGDYLPPKTARPRHVPQQSGCWSFGKLKFNKLTGRTPIAVGTVLDKDQKPISGVEITLKGGHDQPPATRTDDNGEFKAPLSGKDQGPYVVTARRDGYEPNSANREWVEGTLDFGTITLIRAKKEDVSKLTVELKQLNSSFDDRSQSAPGRLDSPGWLLAALGIIVTIVFQTLAFRANRAQKPGQGVALAGPDEILKELDGKLTNLENTSRHAVKLGLAKALERTSPEAQMTTPPAQQDITPSELDSPGTVASDPHGSDSGLTENDPYAGYVQGERPDRFSPVAPQEQAQRRSASGTYSDGLVAEYEQTRSAPDRETAISAFEGRHPCIRLSLVNEKDVKFVPGTVAEFQEDGRGWFLGVGQGGQMLCFPWFSFDLVQQKQTYQAVFQYTGEGVRVRKPAELAHLGEGWKLHDKGSIGG